MHKTFLCSICQQSRPMISGRGYRISAAGERVCFACSAELDRQRMMKQGRATLYLNLRFDTSRGRQKCSVTGRLRFPVSISDSYVSDFTSTLRFPAKKIKITKHNLAGIQYYVWFTGPDGCEWVGVQVGDKTQICHCRRKS